MAKKNKEQHDLQEPVKKVCKYLFTTNLKHNGLLFKVGQVVSMSPCEAKEFAKYVVIMGDNAGKTDCGCKK